MGAAASAGAVDGAVYAEPLYVGGRVLIATENNTLYSIDAASGIVTVTAEARTSAQTGVEMEAMTAASVAALTVYDMVKGVERGVEIASVVLLEKSGGRHDWRR